MATNRKNVNQVRREFVERFSQRTANVVSLLARGLTTEQVATRTGTPVASVRTFKANLSRGAYRPFVSVARNGSFTGSLVSTTR